MRTLKQIILSGAVAVLSVSLLSTAAFAQSEKADEKAQTESAEQMEATQKLDVKADKDRIKSKLKDKGLTDSQVQAVFERIDAGQISEAKLEQILQQVKSGKK